MVTCLKITQLGSCNGDWNPGLRVSERGSTVQRAAGRQFKEPKAQARARRRGSSSLGPSTQPNGQKRTLGRLSPVSPGPALVPSAHLFVALPGISSSVAQPHRHPSLAPGNSSLPTSAQPGSQDTGPGGGEARSMKLWAPFFYLQSQTRTDIALSFFIYSPVTC